MHVINPGIFSGTLSLNKAMHCYININVLPIALAFWTTPHFWTHPKAAFELCGIDTFGGPQGDVVKRYRCVKIFAVHGGTYRMLLLMLAKLVDATRLELLGFW